MSIILYAKSPAISPADPVTLYIITVAKAAIPAISPFILNLSFISAPTPLVAAIVVSEIIDRLSPNIAPPNTVAIATPTFRPAASATPTAIGPIAAIVPIEVPIAVAMKADIINNPAKRNFFGTNVSPKFTTDSTPPVALVTPENAPAPQT